jgi:8-oxo-dGTP pyrophosphatase MutT (NUDIX family)
VAHQGESRILPQPGEELRAAVEREVLEELGLAVAAGTLLDAWTYEPAGADATVVVIAYAARLRVPFCLSWTVRACGASSRPSTFSQPP